MRPSRKTTSSARSCFSCTICCTALEIESRAGYSTLVDSGEDIAKAAGESCRFLTAHGCGVYAQRPAVCRAFRCDWLLGRKGFGSDDSPMNKGFIGVRGVNFAIDPQTMVAVHPDTVVRQDKNASSDEA